MSHSSSFGVFSRALQEAIENSYKTGNQNNEVLDGLLAQCIRQDEWFYMYVRETGHGREIEYRMFHNHAYLVCYTDPSKIQQTPKGFSDLMSTSINMLIDIMFSYDTIYGVVVNPGAHGCGFGKWRILKSLLHAPYPRHGATTNFALRNWGSGIPRYTDNDLLTDDILRTWAMECAFKQHFAPLKYVVVSANDNKSVCPNLILMKDNRGLLVSCTGYCAVTPPALSAEMQKRLLALGAKYHLPCAYAPIGFRSVTDQQRHDNCLALKGDNFGVVFNKVQFLS